MTDITNFIVDKIGCNIHEVIPTSDINNDLGCYGDDFHEYMDEYAEKFEVRMESYKWYFHTEDEGGSNSIGGIFFKAPYQRVSHIPVTPNLLLDNANQGTWLFNYPEHKLPKRRYDIIINQFVVLSAIIFFIYKCTR